MNLWTGELYEVVHNLEDAIDISHAIVKEFSLENKVTIGIKHNGRVIRQIEMLNNGKIIELDLS